LSGLSKEKLYAAEIEMENGLVPYSGNILQKQFGNPVSFAAEVNRKSGYDLFDFGYALTVHKAQGSQAKRVCCLRSGINI
jgi:hypothetical protein